MEPTHAQQKSLDLAKIREAIVDVIETDQEKRGDGTSLYGTMIRLAWHCAGTYSAADQVRIYLVFSFCFFLSTIHSHSLSREAATALACDLSQNAVGAPTPV